jgi:DNA-binding XRE family transcriptional regulator
LVQHVGAPVRLERLHRHSKDFLEEIISERSVRNPIFLHSSRPPPNGASACARSPRNERRTGFTQTEVADATGISQSQIVRLESANIGAKLSTVEKLAAVLGKRVEWRLVDAAR